MQPDFFSTGNPQINIGFKLNVGGMHVATYLFKCFDVDAFQPQASFSELVTQAITSTRTSVDEIPDRVEDVQVTIGDSISTIGVTTRNPLQLRLDGFIFFDGWVEATRGCPSAILSGTWTRTV
ncbi:MULTISPECIES: hypothetical protein [unclassified Bradyrhizobium]|uniref:hypothetical protein n=1 Tax=Bradyrhizobium sp. USDA 4541 TaxID=2817704 RepID=UPI0020A5870B|nr:hypothetical protein [Bradyrhizobium sp. USDA 4541]MCP1850269.1 hypothetical protein [Bradyrhizobium sp. USDA 4541]